MATDGLVAMQGSRASSTKGIDIVILEYSGPIWCNITYSRAVNCVDHSFCFELPISHCHAKRVWRNYYDYCGERTKHIIPKLYHLKCLIVFHYDVITLIHIYDEILHTESFSISWNTTWNMIIFITPIAVDIVLYLSQDPPGFVVYLTLTLRQTALHTWDWILNLYLFFANPIFVIE